MKKGSQWLTAFVCEAGLFEFQIMTGAAPKSTKLAQWAWLYKSLMWTLGIALDGFLHRIWRTRNGWPSHGGGLVLWCTCVSTVVKFVCFICFTLSYADVDNQRSSSLSWGGRDVMAKTTPYMRIDVNTRPTVAIGISQNRCDYSIAKQFQPVDNRNYYNKVKTSIINRMGNKAEAL